ncbi:MAG TPA: glucose-6-phosphate dehydrogenase [Planctomycetota bacterium]|nr:glucose-6-phosphate dehydrogenase [Planctomycetota bacterium]
MTPIAQARAKNPFLEAAADPHLRVEPCSIVIFGASGDLTKRKLLPAIYNLALDGLLPSPVAITGVARRPLTHDDFRAQMKDAVSQFSRRTPIDERRWNELAANFFYVPADFSDAAAYTRLETELATIERERGIPQNRLFYLAVPPDQCRTVVERLGKAGFFSGRRASDSRDGERPRSGWSRVIVEKPFGTDLASARALNVAMRAVLREDQLFRIDHYLGKETVQNLLVFRFSNGIFEPIWNRRYVDHVQITVAETVGVESRAAYFDEAGIVRDIIQNHVLQLLSLVAMEPPVAFDADAVRDEKVKVLRALRPIPADDVPRETSRAQYGAGAIGGHPVPAYLEEKGVDPHSATETFAAMRCFVDNWRWSGIPFYLRAGKRLARRATEIAIQFRSPPHLLFRGKMASRLEPNVLAIRIQPDEGISLRFTSKVPGPVAAMQPVRMDFLYGTSFGVEPPEAYERLLLDAIVGDSTLFTRSDEVETAWEFATPILDAWRSLGREDLDAYAAGSWGPPSAHELIGREGRSWRRI